MTRPPHSPRTAILAQIRSLVAALASSARRVEHRTGITNAQLFLLQRLATEGSCSLSELAGHAQTQLSTVSLVVGRLQRRGLLTRAQATDDRRRVRIALTPAGRRVARAAPEPPTARLLAALDTLSVRDARRLDAALRPLLLALDLAGASPPMLFEPIAKVRRGAPPARHGAPRLAVTRRLPRVG